MHQTPDVTGLPPLVVPDNEAFPKTILYANDYLPLNNSEAEVILQKFISQMSRIFSMQIKSFDVTVAMSKFTSRSATDFAALRSSGGAIVARSKYEGYGKRLVQYWAEKYDGRFPPVDQANRVQSWKSDVQITDDEYATAVNIKREAVEWYEKNIQYSTTESCSESVLLYDIGTGGFPSYREEALNQYPNTTYLSARRSDNAIPKESICPQFGCVDFVVPIGQVSYWSNVTFHKEFLPVTVNMAMKRGCDFVLMNMIEKLASEGVLKTVKTGRTAF